MVQEVWKPPKSTRIPQSWQSCILLGATLTWCNFSSLRFSRGLRQCVLLPEAGFCTCHPHRRICLHVAFVPRCVTYVWTSHSQNGKSQAVGRRGNSRPEPSAFQWKGYKAPNGSIFVFLKKRINKGKVQREEAVVSRRTLCVCAGMHAYICIYIYIHTHTPSYGTGGQSQEPKISPPPKHYRCMNKRKIKNPNKAKAIGLEMVQSQNHCWLQ